MAGDGTPAEDRNQGQAGDGVNGQSPQPDQLRPLAGWALQLGQMVGRDQSELSTVLQWRQ